MAPTALTNQFEFLFVYSFPLALCSMAIASYGMIFAGRRRSLQLYYKVAPSWGARPLLYTIAWTIAYGLAACAFWQARVDDPPKTIHAPNMTWALVSHVCTLAALAVWPWLFFYLKHIFLAFVAVCLALGGAISTCVSFWLISDLAGGLYTFVPVLIAYAVLVNLYVVTYFTIEPVNRRYKNGIQYSAYKVVERTADIVSLPVTGAEQVNSIGKVLIVGRTQNEAFVSTSDDEEGESDFGSD